MAMTKEELEEEQEKKKIDYGDEDDAKPSAAEFAKSLLLGGAAMLGLGDDTDSDEDIPPSTAQTDRPNTQKTDDTLGKNSRPTSRMDIVKFKQPEEWWLSAEAALEMLEKERMSLKLSTEGRPGKLQARLLAANRFVTTKIKDLVKGTVFEKTKAFRDGIEEISHVLPPDTQKEFHKRVCTAAKHGNMEILNALLRFQIDLDMSDLYGTPLHYAAAHGQIEAVRCLLDHGAYAGAPNMRDQTPLHMAAEDASLGCLDMLIHYGARVNARDSGGLTALHVAARNGYTKLIEKLILGGADVDMTNKLGWTPLHMAALGMHNEAMEMLCNQGLADPNVQTTSTSHLGKPGDPAYDIFDTYKGDTPLHFAARKGFYLCLKVLLEHGSKLDTVNDIGQTVAHAAVDSGDIRIVDLLLEYGWDFLGVEDKSGNDCVDHCDEKLVKLLQNGNEEERIQIAKIKDTLTKMTQRRNQEKHKELIEMARDKIVPQKKKNQKKEENQMEMTEAEKDLDELEIDDKTLEDKLTAMRLELEAARAAVKQVEAQTKDKTHALNDVLLETRRKLSETEYQLERERRARADIEKEILRTLAPHGEEEEEEEEEDAPSAEEYATLTPQYSGESGEAYDVLRIQSEVYDTSRGVTAEGGGEDDGIDDERLRRVIAEGDEREGFEEDEEEEEEGVEQEDSFEMRMRMEEEREREFWQDSRVGTADRSEGTYQASDGRPGTSGTGGTYNSAGTRRSQNSAGTGRSQNSAGSRRRGDYGPGEGYE